MAKLNQAQTIYYRGAKCQMIHWGTLKNGKIVIRVLDIHDITVNYDELCN